jgi:hypothetical protein
VLCAVSDVESAGGCSSNITLFVSIRIPRAPHPPLVRLGEAELVIFGVAGQRAESPFALLTTAYALFCRKGLSAKGTRTAMPAI